MSTFQRSSLTIMAFMSTSRRLLCTIPLVAFAACAGRGAPRPLALPFALDTNRAVRVAPGVTQRSIHSTVGPWAIQVLDVDLAQCYSVVAVKGAAGAAGRTKTSVLLENLRSSRDVIGGVNADFFSLNGFQGIPTGVLISRGRVITGPYAQAALAVDSAGVPHLGRLGVSGAMTFRGTQTAIDGWNRPAPARLAFYDASWGKVLDTASSVVEVMLAGRSPSRVVAIDTTLAGATIPTDGGVLVAGRSAPASLRAALLSLNVGDTLRINLAITPFHPREAVGGRPVLVRDSAVAPEVDTEGQASFQARNPRTAAGVANDGKRLILAVIDGRQKPYSDGMSLRETANLMLALGARDAINLDGGGSSTLVYADPSNAGTLRIANHPSDATGERAVGDALAIVKGCDGR